MAAKDEAGPQPHGEEVSLIPSRETPRPSPVKAGRWSPWKSQPPLSPFGASANAEILTWQNTTRIGFSLLFGIVAAALRLGGVIRGTALPIALIVLVYAGIVALTTLVIQRTRRAGLPLMAILGTADIAAIYALVALTVPPQYYARALLLSLIALQFTHFVFGRALFIIVVAVSAAAYATLIFLARRSGAPLIWGEEIWMLVLYLAVAVSTLLRQERLRRRLSMLVDLFAQAERGDFTREYDEGLDREPDGITVLGRAYNNFRAQLATLVLTDPLTGCLNRRGFEQELRRTVARASRYGGELSLLAIDVDHFKDVNDTFGHLAGDIVLRELAGLLTSAARGSDLVARVGGEEFVMLLPNADEENAGVVAERIGEVVRGHAFEALRRGGGKGLTVSVGIATEQVVDAGLSSALRARADEALYVAKRLGRDRVVMWAPGARSHSTPPRIAAQEFPAAD